MWSELAQRQQSLHNLLNKAGKSRTTGYSKLSASNDDARGQALLLCSAPAVQGSLLSAFLRHVAVSLEDAAVVSNSGSLAKDALPQGVFASAVSVSEAAGQHTPALLRVLLGALCPGGELVVQEAQVRVHSTRVLGWFVL